jgi:hypothetical protein
VSGCVNEVIPRPARFREDEMGLPVHGFVHTLRKINLLAWLEDELIDLSPCYHGSSVW